MQSNACHIQCTVRVAIAAIYVKMTKFLYGSNKFPSYFLQISMKISFAIFKPYSLFPGTLFALSNDCFCNSIYEIKSSHNSYVQKATISGEMRQSATPPPTLGRLFSAPYQAFVNFRFLWRPFFSPPLYCRPWQIFAAPYTFDKSWKCPPGPGPMGATLPPTGWAGSVVPPLVMTLCNICLVIKESVVALTWVLKDTPTRLKVF